MEKRFSMNKFRSNTQSHVSLYSDFTNKKIFLQPPRSSFFDLLNHRALYAVNTTNGIMRNYNEDRVSIVVNIKRKKNWKHGN